MSRATAVLIIAYMRDDHIINYLPYLSEEGVQDIYIALDAPKVPALRQKQDAMLVRIYHHLAKYDFNVWLWSRENNLGPAVSVYTAIDWFFQFENKGIILEDDLNFDSGFLKFADKCLTDFEEENQIWLVSGNQFFEFPDASHNPRFSHYPLIWGWATWRERWIDIRASIIHSDKQSGFWLQRARVSYWKVGRKRALSGKVDAWDIPLVSQMWERGKLCAQPPRNLVSNVGADNHSTHTASSEWPLMQPVEKVSIPDQNYTLENLSTVTHVDELLTSQFYEIRFRHFFLPIYAPLIDLFTRNRYSETLENRIKSVDIPKNRASKRG
jgi:hypothetical protein